MKLGKAADIITQHPVALQLRTLQTMAEIATEKNSTIIFPAQFMTTVQEAIAMLIRIQVPNSFESPLLELLPDQMDGYGNQTTEWI